MKDSSKGKEHWESLDEERHKIFCNRIFEMYRVVQSDGNSLKIDTFFVKKKCILMVIPLNEGGGSDHRQVRNASFFLVFFKKRDVLK